MKKHLSKNQSVVTPWSVQGYVDYNKLVNEFGTSLITPQLIRKIKNTPNLISRGLYFSHRDLESWIEQANSKSGSKLSILTGRGPSEKMHLGHLVPFLLAKELQDIYNCYVYLPFSEDEKFFTKPNLKFEQAQEFTNDNILDIVALGFKPNKTKIIRDFSYSKLYSQSSKIAKLITYSQAKAIFGLAGETNLGWTFYPAVQAFHILWPQFDQGAHHTLVPIGIDQDSFIRLTRDIAAHSTLNFIKPSAIHSKFLPSLKGSSKMSASDSDADQNVIYLSDTPELVKKKINKYAFSGGKDTLEEHRKHGGNPDIDVSFLYLKYLFEPDDRKLKKIESDYKSGKLLSGELKAIAIEKINSFLSHHRGQKLKVKSSVDRFMLKN